MDFLNHLRNAITIKSTGLMKGLWRRTKSEDPSKTNFQSETHPNYTLTFTRTFLVTVGVDEDRYSYYWDPETWSLTSLQDAKNGDTLSVDVLCTDSTIVKPVKSTKVPPSFMEEENQVLRAKIDDLSKQVQSLQVICLSQERKLRSLPGEGMKNETDLWNIKEKPEKLSMEDNNIPGVKPPFSHFSIPSQHSQNLPQQQRPYPYDPVHMYELRGGPPFPHGRTSYQPWGGPPLPHQPSSYQSGGALEAHYGYHPYRLSFQVPSELDPYANLQSNDHHLQPVPAYPELYPSAQNRPPSSLNVSYSNQIQKKQCRPVLTQPPTSFTEPYVNHVQDKPKEGNDQVEGNRFRKSVSKNTRSNYEKEQAEGGSAAVQSRPVTSVVSKSNFALDALSQQSVNVNVNSGYNYHVDQNERTSVSNVRSRQRTNVNPAPWTNAMTSFDYADGENKVEINHHVNAPYTAEGDNVYKEGFPPIKENKASKVGEGSAIITWQHNWCGILCRCV